jgi:hypothetical protein
MNTKNKMAASDRVRALADKLDTQDETETLEVMARLIDALQYAQGYSYSNPMIKIANFVASVADVPWDALQFSLTKAVATNGRAYKVAQQYGAELKDIPKLLLEAVTLFADLLAENVVADPAPPAADIFDAVVAELAENSKAALAPAQKTLPPEIYSPKMVNRVFEPAPFSMELAGKLQMTLVTYTSTQGNDLLALAFDAPGDDKTYFLILETGECVEAKKADCSLALIDEESYANIPSALLAFVYLAGPELEICDVIRSATALAIEGGAIGKFKTDVCVINVKNDDLQPLHHVIDMAHGAGSMGGTGATGPTGALLKFPVPNVPGLAVVLEAQVGATGPYVLARLVEASASGDRVLMRLDQPRHDAVKGLYFFPHAKQAVVLKA